MSLIDLAKLRSTPLVKEPFEFCIVPEFLPRDVLDQVEADFPLIDQGGSFPLSSLSYGPAFAALVEELRSDTMRDAFGDYFGIDLSGRPPTITVRGRARSKDGQIHIDSKTKLITVLIYFNRNWIAEGGRLRLLRSPDNLEDVIAEAPPESGLMMAFRCRENAWHGHKPHDGVRRSIQLNWVVDESAASRSERRHKWSSLLKRLKLAG